jgi:hypothetical protein
MPDGDGLKFPDDFLSKIDSGQVDAAFVRDLGRLTEEQRGELARLLAERQARRERLN